MPQAGRAWVISASASSAPRRRRPAGARAGPARRAPSRAAAGSAARRERRATATAHRPAPGRRRTSPVGGCGSASACVEQLARQRARASWHVPCVSSPCHAAVAMPSVASRPARSRARTARAAARADAAGAALARATLTLSQQELLVVVAARLADGALRRPRLRRGDGLARRRRRPQGAAAARAVDPRAVPARTTARRSGTRWRSREYLDEIVPRRGLLPADRIARAHCRSVSGEMNSGFANLRASLPMNLKAHYPKHRVWGGAKPDIERIVEIWTRVPRHLRRAVPVRQAARHGRRHVRAGRDALPAPTTSTLDAGLPALLRARSWRCRRCASGSPRRKAEPDDIDELDMEF